MTIAIIIIAYLIGVAVALACIAWTNAGTPNCGPDDEMPKAIAIISWIVPVAILLFCIVILAARGLNKLFSIPYNWLYRRFDKK